MTTLPDQIVELVLAIAQGQVDTQSMFTLDDKAVKNIRFCADQWWRMLLTETMHDNGLIAVVTSGKDAGRARQYDGTPEVLVPNPTAATALMLFLGAQQIIVPDLNEIVDERQ